MTRRGRMREWHLNWSNVHNPHIRTNPYFCSHTLQYHGGIYHRLYSLLHTHTCQYSRFSVKASTGNTQVQNSISTAALSAPSLWQTWNLLPWTNRAQQIRRWLWFSVCARNNGGVGSCGCLYSINNHSGWAGPEGHLEMLGGQEHGSWLQQQLSWWHLNSKDNTQDSLNQFCLPAKQHSTRSDTVASTSSFNGWRNYKRKDFKKHVDTPHSIQNGTARLHNLESGATTTEIFLQKHRQSVMVGPTWVPSWVRRAPPASTSK